MLRDGSTSVAGSIVFSHDFLGSWMEPRTIHRSSQQVDCKCIVSSAISWYDCCLNFRRLSAVTRHRHGRVTICGRANVRELRFWISKRQLRILIRITFRRSERSLSTALLMDHPRNTYIKTHSRQVPLRAIARFHKS